MIISVERIGYIITNILATKNSISKIIQINPKRISRVLIFSKISSKSLNKHKFNTSANLHILFETHKYYSLNPDL